MGKTSLITKDGSIDAAMSTSKMPINKITSTYSSINNPTYKQDNQLISFANNT